MVEWESLWKRSINFHQFLIKMKIWILMEPMKLYVFERGLIVLCKYLDQLPKHVYVKFKEYITKSWK